METKSIINIQIPPSLQPGQGPIGQAKFQMRPVPASTVPQTMQQPQNPVATSQGQEKITSAGSTSFSVSGGVGQQMGTEADKIKCKNFLASVLRMANDQPSSAATNICNLVHGLINGQVEPELFGSRLQQELNSAPQPHLVPFLKRSLPHLQQALRTGAFRIEGICAPTSSLPQSGPMPRVCIQRPATRGIQNSPTSCLPQSNPKPRMVRVLKPATRVIQCAPTSSLPQTNPMRTVVCVQRPATKVIPQSSPTFHLPQSSPMPRVAQVQRPAIRVIKQCAPTSESPQSSSMPRVVQVQRPATRVMQQPTVKSVPRPHVAGLEMTTATVANGVTAPLPKTNFQLSSPIPGVLTSAQSTMHRVQTTSTSLLNSSSAISAAPINIISNACSTADEDINDVAAMGGVNLDEENQCMQGNFATIGTQLRSCKDETSVEKGSLHQRVAKICLDKGLEEPSSDVIELMSCATKNKLKTLIEKLSVIAEHRMDVIGLEGDSYEVVKDVRGQLNFLSDLDKVENRRYAEARQEALLKIVSKSRTKTDDLKRKKLVAEAKELQRKEKEQLRHEMANNTALMAIGGSNKILKVDKHFTGKESSLSTSLAVRLKQRTKRVNIRDAIFLMEQEKELKRSPLLWKTYLTRL